VGKYDRFLVFLYHDCSFVVFSAALIIPIGHFQHIWTGINIWNASIGLHVTTVTIISCIITFYTLSFRIFLDFWQWGVFMFPFFILIDACTASLHTLVQLGLVEDGQDKYERKRVQFYKRLYIIISLFNKVNSTTLLILKFVCIASIITGCSAFVFAGATSVSIATLATSLLVLFGLLLMFKHAATLFEEALDMRLQVKNGVTHGSLMHLVGMSMRPCRIIAGTQYYLDKGVPLKILDAVTSNIINVVLAVVWSGKKLWQITRSLAKNLFQVIYFHQFFHCGQGAFQL